MGCLDEEQVSGLVSGALSPAEVDAARAHLGECVACRVLVAETAKSVEGSGSVDAGFLDTLIGDASYPGLRERGGLVPGSVVGGKYRILCTLGRGGMGTVLAAVHLQLRFEVAIKVLRGSMLSRRDIVGRFMREARAAARIKSPRVVSVLDVGGLPSGEPFIVMERLRGNDLSEEIARRGRVPIQEAVDLTVEICDAVAQAHAMGVIHRDLKPANVFLCKSEGAPSIVKVLDFGISKMSDTGSKTSPDFSTEVQSWLGTPRYMAPEQITLGRNVDERADIWAIGTLLYELVAGHPPFQDKSLDVLCKRVLEEPPSALAEESAEPLPRGLDAVVARCLEKSPEARYQTVGILARALGPFASTSHAETVARIGALPGMAPSEGESAMASSPVLSSARRRGAWLGVLGAAIAIGAGAVMLAGPASPSRASQGPRRAGESASAMVETAPDPIAKPAASLSSAPSSSPSEAPPRRGAVHRYPRPTPAPTVKHPEFGGRL